MAAWLGTNLLRAHHRSRALPALLQAKEPLNGHFRACSTVVGCLNERLRPQQDRREVAEKYLEGLKGIKQVTLPEIHPSAESVFHLFVVLAEKREALSRYLKDRGIETGIHYPLAVHELPVFSKTFYGQHFPIAEKIAHQGISLPMCPKITQGEIDYVIACVSEFYSKNSH